MKLKTSWYLTLRMLFLLLCPVLMGQNDPNKKEKNKEHLNVILLIGDGMGLSQINATMLRFGDSLNLTRMKDIGLIRTDSYNKPITDSAAGATAFSIGYKTYNGSIGVDSKGKSRTTIMEDVKKLGYKTGIVCTSSITHATPASFYAHVKHRSFHEEIALQFLESELDFAAGGGLKFFIDRKDGRNLLKENALSKYSISSNFTEPVRVIQDDKKQLFLKANDGLPKVTQGRANFLSNAVNESLRFLNSSDEPFLLMVEGSQIDWGGHSNEIEYIISELKDFDEALGNCLDFAEKNGNTLVIVTADHETGGLTIIGSKYYMNLEYNFSISGSGAHTAALIPVFAYGPQSSTFTGFYDNTGIYSKLRTILIEN